MQQQQRGKKELLFIDTSAWIALYDQDDAFHKEAVSFFTPDNLRARKLIPVTTNFIFDEVYTYFCRNHGVALTIGQSLKASQILKVLRVEEADEAKAWEIVQKYTDIRILAIRIVPVSLLCRD